MTQRAVGASKCASYECTQQEVLWPLHSVYKLFPKGTMTSPTRGESTLLPTLTQDSCKDLWGFEQHPKVVSRVKEHGIYDIEELAAKYDHVSSSKGGICVTVLPCLSGTPVSLSPGPRLCIQQEV